MTEVISLGQFVCSKAGRDRGRIFIVIDIIDNEYVKVVDGDLRKVENPKKKKIRHLQKYHAVSDETKTKLEKGEQIENAAIRRAIETIGEID